MVLAGGAGRYGVRRRGLEWFWLGGGGMCRVRWRGLEWFWPGGGSVW